MNKSFHCSMAIISSPGLIALKNIKASPYTATLFKCNSLSTGSKLYHYIFWNPMHQDEYRIFPSFIISFYIHYYLFPTAKISIVLKEKCGLDFMHLI